LKKRLRNLFLAVLAAMALTYPVWFYLFPNHNYPRTQGEAVLRIKAGLSEESLHVIKFTGENDLAERHPGILAYIIYDLGLLEGNMRLYLSVGRPSLVNPEQMSVHLLQELWKDLQKDEDVL
jgi:hypothetical protein